VRWLFRRAGDLPLPGRALQSEAALERVRRGLIEQLQVAAAARRTRHRFWNELHRSLDGEALESIDPAFRDIRARQRVDFEERMRRVTGAASALVARRPLLVRALQYGRLILELFLVIGATWWLWSRVNWPVLLVAIPLLLGLIDAAIRFGCKRFIDGYRDDLVRMQRDDVREAVHAGYLEPLLKLPKGAGPRLAEISDAAEKLPLLLAEIAPAEGARP